MSNLAIIPARANSRRIPKKNIKELMGKPLIGYTIDACKRSGVIDSIIVTSDSEEILDYAKSEGAIAHLRPAEYAVEKTKNELEDTRSLVLDYARNIMNFQKYLFLLPTYPFRSAALIQKAIEALDKSNFVVSIEKLQKNNLEEHVVTKRNPLIIKGDLVRWNSYINGARVPREKNFEKYTFIEVNPIQNIDIDTDLDWVQAEYILQNNIFDFKTGDIKGDFLWRLST